jgi:hypothetical protein
MTERPSAAREIADLMAAIPGPFAPAAELAAWLRRKAAIQWRIAAETDDPTLAENARALAASSERHALEVEAES